MAINFISLNVQATVIFHKIYLIFSDPKPDINLSAAISRRSIISASSCSCCFSAIAASYFSPSCLSSLSNFTNFLLDLFQISFGLMEDTFQFSYLNGETHKMLISGNVKWR